MCGNFQILIASAVRICKQCRQDPYRGSLLDHTGELPTPDEPLSYKPHVEIPVAATSPATGLHVSRTVASLKQRRGTRLERGGGTNGERRRR